MLNGNSYAHIIRNNSGQVTKLVIMPNDETTVTQDDTTGKLTYYFHGEKLNSSDVLHFKVFTQDGFKGISPIYALRDQIDIQHSKDDTVTKYFKHGYIGKSILTVLGSDLGAEAKQAIRDKFLKANDNDSGVIILDENTKYQNLPVDKSVVEVANEIDWTTRQVASALGLPVEILGVENEHSSNEQSMLSYLQSTLTYYFRCITSELDAKLATGNYHFNFDTSKLFTADTTVMFNMYESAIKNNLLTPNEARNKLGLPPVEGGDQLQSFSQTSQNDNFVNNSQNMNEN
ncbi:phage portal protein [Lactobacillus reuteri]|nr:phage portal protein [Limosilactobacillus reuteri]